jgi:tetratricopeptide (TPR) repeat protein
MSFECANLGLDYLILYKRVDDLNFDWVAEQGPYNVLLFEVLKASARGIKDNFSKCQSIVIISTEIFKQGLFEEALSAMKEAISYAHDISDDDLHLKSIALIDISAGLAKLGLLEEALSFAKSIGDELETCSALVAISQEFFTIGKLEESLSSIEEAISYVHRFEKHYDHYDLNQGSKKSRKVLFSIWIGLFKLGKIEESKSFARSFLEGEEINDWDIVAISTEYSIQGKFDKALTNARSINNDYKKSRALVAISSQLYKQSKFDEASLVMQEALTLSQDRTKYSGTGIGSILEHANSLKAICIELAKQGKFEEALALTNSHALGGKLDLTLAAIYSEMIKKDKLEEASNNLHEALSCNRGISERLQYHLLAEVSTELTKLGKIENSITCMPHSHEMFIKLSIELMKQGKTKEASTALQEAIPYARAKSLNIWKINALVAISTEQFKQGQKEFASSSLNEALSCIDDINSNWDNSKEGISRSLDAQVDALFTISTEMAKQGRFDEALTIARSLNNEHKKSRALFNELHVEALAMISTEFYKQGKLEESSSAIVDAFSSAMGISVAKSKNDLNSSDFYKCRALVAISSELFKQSKLIESSKVINEAISFALNIRDHDEKGSTLERISKELVNQGNFEQAITILRSLNNDYDETIALQDISMEMAKQSKFDKALTIVRSLNNDYEKSRALAWISTEFYKQSKFEEASSAINESTSFAVNISDEEQKTWVFTAISCALAIQGKFEEAEKIGLKILNTAERHKCWRGHAKKAIENNSWRLALPGVQGYKNDEARLFYSREWTKNVAIKDLSAKNVSQVLPLLAYDIESIELLLQKFALQETFLTQTLPELQQRLNRTLNIQWAIEIKNQFVN